MITSPANEKLKTVRRLLAKPRDRAREGLFVAEGEDLVAAGLASGHEPLFLLKASGAGEDLPGADRAVEVEDELLHGASSLGSGCRILGVWPRISAEPPARSLCVYLDGVGDPGNVGAIVRSAHALIGGGVVLGPDCADPFGPKAVRASMGSIFAAPPARAAIEALPRPLIGLAAHGGEWPLEHALAGGAEGPLESLTLAVGGEREGLSPELCAACDALVTIPLPGGAESLNVAAAAAICLERVSSLAVLATGSELDSPNERTDA